MKIVDETEAFMRRRIEEKLSECSAQAQALFRRIYPNGVPTNDLRQAAALIERTIKIASPARADGGGE